MVGLLENVQVISVNSFLIFMSISLFVWYYLKNKFHYWSSRGVPYVSPATCFLNSIKSTFGGQNIIFGFDNLYKRLDGHKYGGTFQLTEPALLIRDPEVIKLALIKGFSNFHDRGPAPDESYDPLAGNLFALVGERWHQVRRNFSPAFSGARLKILYRSLQSCAKELNTELQKMCSGTGNAEINLKEIMSNYTLDVIGACAMGVECDSIRNPNSEFKRILRKSLEFNIGTSIFIFLSMIHPKIPQIFRIRPRAAEVEEFLITVCINAMEMKATDTSSTRKDFLQIMMNLRSHENEKTVEETEDSTLKVESSDETNSCVFTENLLMGVISIFLFAGFEPVAATLTFCLYELALHPEIQDNIFKEIQTLKKEACDEISYEDLRKLQYTDQVINSEIIKSVKPCI